MTLHETPIEPDYDLAMSVAIQSALMPTACPRCDHVRIAARNRMKRMVGGDFHDFYQPDSRHRAFLIGDVTGHGVYAALVMAFIYGVLREIGRSSTAPEDVVSRVNDSLYSVGHDSAAKALSFSATLFYGVLNLGAREMVYVNAGHPYPLVLRRNGGGIDELKSTTRLLGLLPSEDLVAERVVFDVGDRLILFTDGVPETRNGQGEIYGLERFRQEATRLRNASPDECIRAQFEAIDAFRSPLPPGDDMSVVVVDFLEPPA